MPEEVIELSISETNRLRAELGLAPLRGVQDAGSVAPQNAAPQNAAPSGEQVLELSVDESNNLRAKLGMPPLKDGKSEAKEQHAPAQNQGVAKEAADRIEKSKLRRQVQEGLSKFDSSSLGASEPKGEGSVLSWAQQMRHVKEGKSQKASNKKQHNESNKTYSEADLKGINVAHSSQDIEHGSTTVLTLADSEILDVKDDPSRKLLGLKEDEARLENVNLIETQKQRDGLKEKRKMEMGMGRAGGYAGFDDDEFIELGGTHGPSKSAREEKVGGAATKQQRGTVGFQIGAMLEEQEEETDLFSAQAGKAVSLESRYGDTDASDFMTVEEDAKMNPKKKKKDAKFKKSKKKKKEKKRRKRHAESDDEEQSPLTTSGSNLLAELEETAGKHDGANRKRRRETEDDDPVGTVLAASSSVDVEAESRSKYAAIMEKGNKRTQNAFQKAEKKAKVEDPEDEPDDAFLNAALSKARRLNRLKQLKAESAPRGEELILEAVKSSNSKTEDVHSGGKGSVVFSVDETREFTRAIRAREEQSERVRVKSTVPVKTEPGSSKAEVSVKVEDVEEEDEHVNMSDLAKEIKDDEVEPNDGGMDGGTGAFASTGRGLGGVLSMLKQTGEITKKNAGREEMRGRAKDKRTYEDYEPLELSKVVQVDERTATDKDKEIANREVKLEYRDEHGRLLTRKEAFRELSYQFHGYGSGKRKQEKKLQQIAREQAEQRMQSKQAAEGGILGAMKATQKATGKAFIVHKTT